MFRLVVCNIFFERWRRLIFAALGFDGDDFSAVLQHKVDLTVFVGVVPRFYLKLTLELLQHIVFGECSLELLVAFQQDRSVVNACHLLEQSGIKDKELELIELVKGRQRMLHLRYIVDAVQHTG